MDDSSSRIWDELPRIRGLFFGVVACLVYALACRLPAVHLDNHVNGGCTNLGSGLGSPDGLGCLLFGWSFVPFCFSWMANLCLPAAFLSLILHRRKLATSFGAAAAACGFLTPFLLWQHPHYPASFPLTGYYLWQMSLIATLAAVLLSDSQAKLGHYLLCASLPLLLLLVQAGFKERARGIWIQVSGRVQWPEGTKPSDRRFQLTLPEVVVHRDRPELVTTIDHWTAGFSLGENGEVAYKGQLFTSARPTYAKLSVSVEGKRKLEIPNVTVFPAAPGDNVYSVQLKDVVVPVEVKVEKQTTAVKI